MVGYGKSYVARYDIWVYLIGEDIVNNSVLFRVNFGWKSDGRDQMISHHCLEKDP